MNYNRFEVIEIFSNCLKSTTFIIQYYPAGIFIQINQVSWRLLRDKRPPSK